MRKLVPAVLVAVSLAAFAADAWAGQITEASGPVQVNGKPATLPVTLKKGDVVETGTSTATFKSDAGDTVVLDRQTSARSEGAEAGIEYLFLNSGSARGTLSDRTSVGVSAGWATAPEKATTEVQIEAPAERAGIEGRFRTLRGGTWIRSDGYRTWLLPAHSVTLWRDRAKPGSMCFRTSQQNEQRVEIFRTVAGGDIRVTVPRATSGCFEDFAGNKTKISNDITSNKQEKLRVETLFGAQSGVDVGPGTYALIDNTTGTVELVDDLSDDAVGEEIPQFDSVDDASDASISRRTRR